MEKINYISIIRKSDFTDLFKYGWLNIYPAIPFNGNIQSSDNEYFFDALTRRINMFEYSMEYLIVHFKSEKCDTIDIKDVQRIYAFDEQAQKEMKTSFDPRIKIYICPWVDKIQKMKNDFFVKQCLRGIDNIWTIFNLSGDDRNKCKSIITDEIVKEVFNELFANKRPEGDLSIWVYLLRYERHSLYPKESQLGYFCDCIHTFINWKSKKEKEGEVAITTEAYMKLEKSDKSNFAPLKDLILKQKINTISEAVAGCRFVVAAPLFLFLKKRFSDGIEKGKYEKIVELAKKEGQFEFAIAAYLLGITLGYNKTYDAYYDVVKLPLFEDEGIVKSTISTSIPSSEEKKVDDRPDKETNEKEVLSKKEIQSSKNKKKEQEPSLFTKDDSDHAPESNKDIEDNSKLSSTEKKSSTTSKKSTPQKKKSTSGSHKKYISKLKGDTDTVPENVSE